MYHLICHIKTIVDNFNLGASNKRNLLMNRIFLKQTFSWNRWSKTWHMYDSCVTRVCNFFLHLICFVWLLLIFHQLFFWRYVFFWCKTTQNNWILFFSPHKKWKIFSLSLKVRCQFWVLFQHTNDVGEIDSKQQ